MSLPTAPNRLLRPDTLDDDADAFFGALAGWYAELLGIYASVAANQAGGAFAFKYTFDTATANVDPGSGKLRLSNATQNTATAVYLDLIGSDGTDYTAISDTLDASTSTIKGYLTLTKAGDPTKWATFAITGRAATSGYRAFYVTPVASSTANPFANGDQLLGLYTRNGDKGDQGSPGVTDPPQIYVREEYANGTGVTGTSFNNTARALNTVKTNNISGASLASSQVTLPAGTYNFLGSATANNVNAHRVALYNVTDAAVQEYGTTERVDANSYVVSTRSFVRGRFTITASKTFSLRHWMASSATGAGGSASSLAGGNEVFSELLFEKVA